MLVVTGNILDLYEHYSPWVIYVHAMHIGQQSLNPLAALWISVEAKPVYILPGLSGGAWGNLSLLQPYLWISQWRLKAPYGLKPRTDPWLARLLIRPWDLFSLNSGTFLSKYVNLISVILRIKKPQKTGSLLYLMSLPLEFECCDASPPGISPWEKG